jgi:rod shape determining protein RodA
MAELALHRKVEWPIVGALVGILALGVSFVASADPTGGAKAVKQLVWISFGICLALTILHIGYVRLIAWSTTIYPVFLVLLFGVLFTRPINGATSWYDLRLFRFQPSEFTKIVVILTTAHYLMYRDNFKRIWGLIVPLGITLLPVALILKQPDLGTVMTFFPVLFAMLYAAGARIKHLAMTAAAGLGGIVFLWFFLMSHVQKMRVHSWLDPQAYQAKEAYQLIQSMIAIGSGGLWGQGYSMGPQNRLGRLPERETDFIVAVLAEEWGLFGVALLLALFLTLILFGLNVASRTRDPAGRVIAVGVCAMFAGQVFINVGVVTGLLPTTGVTCPMMSYGGSSMMSSFMGLGLLLSVGATRSRSLRQSAHGGG